MSSSNNERCQHVVDSEEFARILTKQAVAHICVGLGFTVTTAGTLECLTDVVQQYLEDMAKQTMENTHRAGRTEANVTDVLQGLQQMPIPVDWMELRDFAFGKDGKGSSVGSIALAGAGEEMEELQERAKRWDQPFHNTVPSFPLPRKRPALWGELDDDVAEGQEKGMGEEKQGREGGEQEGGTLVEGARKRVRAPHIPESMPPLPIKPSSKPSVGSRKKPMEIRFEHSRRRLEFKMALRRSGLFFNPGSDGSSSISAAIKPSGRLEKGVAKTNWLAGATITASTASLGAGNEEKPRLTLSLKLGKKGKQSKYRVIMPNARELSRATSDSGEMTTGAGSASGEAQRGEDDGERFRNFNREQRILEDLPLDG